MSRFAVTLQSHIATNWCASGVSSLIERIRLAIRHMASTPRRLA